jgi:hypothetical protein
LLAREDRFDLRRSFSKLDFQFGLSNERGREHRVKVAEEDKVEVTKSLVKLDFQSHAYNNYEKQEFRKK